MASGSFEAQTSNKAIYGTVSWSSTLNTSNNTSNVTASLTLRKHYTTGVTKITSGTGTWTLYINEVPYTITAGKTFNFVSDTIVISNTVTVPHEASGYKECMIRVTGGIPGTSYTSTRAESVVVLDANVVKATIDTAPNFTDLENPTITFSNPKGYPVQFKIEDTTGSHDLITTSKLTNYTDYFYTFELTEPQRETLRTASANYSEFPIRFTVSSYIPAESVNPTYWSWLDRTLTIVNGEPTFTDFNHEDIEPESLALTGDSSVYIQNISRCQITIPQANKMVANKQSTPRGYNCWFGDNSNYKSYVSSGTLTFDPLPINYNYPNLIVNAFDSREKYTTVTKPITLIPYDINNSSFSASVSRQDGLNETVNLSCNGFYCPVVVGGVQKNTVTVTFKYKESGATSWDFVSDYTATLGINNSFSLARTYTLDVNKEYETEISCSDFHDSIGETFTPTIPKGRPIFYISKNNKVGVNKIPDSGGDEGLYLAPNDQFYKQLYPVGAVYTALENSVNLDEMFEGTTWTPVSAFTGEDDNVYIHWARTV